MSKPELKILEHPSVNMVTNLRVIEFDDAIVTIEYTEDKLTNAMAVWFLEKAKLEIMGK